ncbi:MAG: hypothetical protein A2031_07410 [Deltaproteobacteria bacterium RBG_19FT_COMBO_43_11]|nr:MAG: hypothetical protein A2031_07410 [Deltaproteobacteria bacterium RBG_19FT_COMBO_43_11]
MTERAERKKSLGTLMVASIITSANAGSMSGFVHAAACGKPSPNAIDRRKMKLRFLNNRNMISFYFLYPIFSAFLTDNKALYNKKYWREIIYHEKVFKAHL